LQQQQKQKRTAGCGNFITHNARSNLLTAYT